MAPPYVSEYFPAAQNPRVDKCVNILFRYLRVRACVQKLYILGITKKGKLNGSGRQKPKREILTIRFARVDYGKTDGSLKK